MKAYWTQLSSRKRIIILIVCIIILCGIALLANNVTKKTNVNDIPELSTIYVYRANLLNQKNQKQVLQDAYVGQLLNFLPYSGYSFSMTYNYLTNQFIVTRKAGTTDQFNTEFDSFLIKHKIQSRTWLNNLIIKNGSQ